MKRIASGIVLISLVLSLLLTGCFGGGKPSTPRGVYDAISPGMTLQAVYGKIDADYARGSCYVVNCSSIIQGWPGQCEPTDAMDSPYFLWVFMPVFSEAQATAVRFTASTSTVGAVSRVDYDSAQALIALYGERILW